MPRIPRNVDKAKIISPLDRPRREKPYRYVKHQKLLLKTHPQFNEKWVQERIAEDPSILGIGELVLKDRERNQPGAGRLDLLLQDPDANIRYEVEIQLGKTDESHIFRTIEYWDREKKLYPQYDHVAVLVAEDVTSRFLNVIGLLNSFIPLVAIQLNAIQIRNQITLISTVILDQRVGIATEEEEEQETTNRRYWEARSSKATIEMADEVLRLLKRLDRKLELKYNKFYISLSRDNKPFNFAIFRPKKTSLRVEPRLRRAEDVEIMLESAGLDVLEYDVRNQRYRIHFSKDEISKHKRMLIEILGRSYREFSGYPSTDAA